MYDNINLKTFNLVKDIIAYPFLKHLRETDGDILNDGITVFGDVFIFKYRRVGFIAFANTNLSLNATIDFDYKLFYKEPMQKYDDKLQKKLSNTIEEHIINIWQCDPNFKLLKEHTNFIENSNYHTEIK